MLFIIFGTIILFKEFGMNNEFVNVYVEMLESWLLMVWITEFLAVHEMIDFET